ncbi:MAG: ABC transporter ATP-binding protein [Epsilonproteobacteria bacterium]|nr:ABC transporter ATP-binding protein [Campylobacterota bacterium]NPA89615.1 ABC transporter ATP-binding protein [Campylobacterota bacterium]
MLTARNLKHSFDYLLFEGVNFSLQPREKVAIVGASGSGKSTLLHILSSFLPPNQGEVEIFGKNIYTLSPSQLIELRRREIGIIFQFHYLFSTFTAYENIEVSAILAGEEIDPSLIERLGIQNVLHQNIQTLSGGQQQRVSIARVLTKKPRLIFADEPTGNLDRENGAEVVAILKEYTDEVNGGLVVVTHDWEVARQLEKVYRLENHQLLPVPPEELEDRGFSPLY